MGPRFAIIVFLCMFYLLSTDASLPPNNSAHVHSSRSSRGLSGAPTMKVDGRTFQTYKGYVYIDGRRTTLKSKQNMSYGPGRDPTINGVPLSRIEFAKRKKYRLRK